MQHPLDPGRTTAAISLCALPEESSEESEPKDLFI